MWFVSSVEFSDRYSDADIYPTQCIYGKLTAQKRFAIHVTMQDAETWECIKLVNKSWDWGNLQQELEEYNPYGYVRLNNDDFVVVTVDRFSAVFASNVKSVEMFGSTDDVALGDVLGDLHPSVELIGQDLTMVQYPTMAWNYPPHLSKLVFSLFHVMCLFEKGWYDERLYLRTARHKWYRIEFDDYKKARALVSKAVVNGCNPIAEFDLVRPSLIVKGAY